jgi:hypothetical protein
MKKASKCILVVALAMLLIPASRTAAEEGDFTGQIMTGFRLVDVGGQANKYREDINLESGPRLFDLRFEFVPNVGFRSAVDRVNVDLDNFGGDPFEALRIGVRKYGAYKFDYRRTKSTYFYNDIILPVSEVEDVSKAQAGDFHHFNFDRIRDVASLEMNFNQNARMNFGLERFTKMGESTTSYDIARDEFEFDKPVHESMNTYSGGIEYSWDKMTIAFDERIQDYENMFHVFLPGISEGEDVEDDAILTSYFLDQPYDYLSLQHTIRAMARPNEKFNVNFAGIFQDLDIDLAATEEITGINYDSTALDVNNAGTGGIDRTVNLFDIDAAYSVSEMVAVTGGFRYHKLDQDGEFTWAGEDNLGAWDIKTTGVEVGAEIFVSPEVTAHGGILYEKRETEIALTFEGEEVEHHEEEPTKNTGFIAGLGWDPVPEFDMNFDLEINTFDDPFTMASPTDRKRYRVRAMYRLANGLSVSGNFLFKDYENDNSGWMADNKQFNVRLGYQQEIAAVSFGYGMVMGERQIDQIIIGGTGDDPNTQPANIFYEVDSKFVDGRARVKANDRMTLGGSFRFYKNDGSFGIERSDLHAWIDFDCPAGYLIHLGYKWVDFNETDFDWDDYDSNIGELSVGYQW